MPLVHWFLELHWLTEAQVHWTHLSELPEINIFQYDHMVSWPLFSVSCFCECLAASVMQMLKSLTSPWKLSAELYAKMLQSPHEEMWVHSVLLSASSCVCLCALSRAHKCCCAYVYMCKEEKEDCVKEAERVSLCFSASSIITPWQLIPLHSALVELALLSIISVQIPVQSFTQIACSCLPLFAFTICCDRQPGTLLCLITISVQSYYSVTERALTYTGNLPFTLCTQCDV